MYFRLTSCTCSAEQPGQLLSAPAMRGRDQRRYLSLAITWLCFLAVEGRDRSGLCCYLLPIHERKGQTECFNDKQNTRCTLSRMLMPRVQASRTAEKTGQTKEPRRMRRRYLGPDLGLRATPVQSSIDPWKPALSPRRLCPTEERVTRPFPMKIRRFRQTPGLFGHGHWWISESRRSYPRVNL